FNKLANKKNKYRFYLENCGFFIGVIDFYGILKEDEVFIQYEKENGEKAVVTGDILVTKNPCLSPFDIQKVKGISNKRFEEYFTNVIVFPAKGKIPMPSKITGSDLDGDVHWVCWDKRLMKIKKDFMNYDDKAKMIINDQEPKEEEKYFKTKEGKTKRRYFIRINQEEYSPKDYWFMQKKCLDFHVFYHKNYKLPQVMKEYLAYVNNLTKKDKHKELTFSDIVVFEALSYYHSIEVDFQKAGITSDFRRSLEIPDFLRKYSCQNRMNMLLMILYIYREYTKKLIMEDSPMILEDEEGTGVFSFSSIQNKYKELLTTPAKTNCSSLPETERKDSEDKSSTENKKDFYEYFESFVDETERKALAAKESMESKKEFEKEMYEKSFIYSLYKLVSYFNHMKEAFMNSVYMISDEFFYKEHIFEEEFKIKNLKVKDIDGVKNIFRKVREITDAYENRVKHLMSDNEIFTEAEISLLIEIIEPKIQIFKNDSEDYKLKLAQEMRSYKKYAFEQLEELRKEYGFTKDGIRDLLFITIFWSPYHIVKIGTESMDLKEVLTRQNIITDKKTFLLNLVKFNDYGAMKTYYFQCLKCFSLYYYYVYENEKEKKEAKGNKGKKKDKKERFVDMFDVTKEAY
ncbi:MAG: RNA dependent RNA polymerase, partial [archaeon]|nr:RNA dependent RNA polymerase [archaeon]